MTKKKKKLELYHLRVKKPAVHRRRGVRISLLGACLATFIVIFLIFFSLTGTSLAPIMAGKLSINSTASPKDMERQISAAAANHLLTINYPDKTKKAFALSEVGVAVDSRASAKNIKKHIDSNLLQRLAWWQPINLQLTTKTDGPKLAYFIGNKALVVTTPPANANLTAPEGVATIVSETPGSGHTIKNAEQTVSKKVAALSDQPLILAPQTLSPDILAKDLEPAKVKLTQILAQSIQFRIGPKTVVVSPADIAGWVEITPVIKDKTADITVNSGKVVEYIEQITANDIQPPRSRLVMAGPTGELVLDAGSNGVDISQKDETAATVAQQAQKGAGYTAELPIKFLAAKTVRVPLAPKVLVVDTTTKRMYAYENTSLVKTVLVSAGAPDTPTVMGQYAIYAKHTKQDMRGANVDGSRYFQANVPYVNYFHKDYAIHGNYWRDDSYFGNINSSHGCVGINEQDDAWIYDWAPIGTPVIVHE